jgi:hypothetical protein
LRSLWNSRFTFRGSKPLPASPGQGAVVVAGAAADLVEEFGWEPDGDHLGEASPAASGRPLGGLVLGVGVEVVFLLAVHLLGPRFSVPVGEVLGGDVAADGTAAGGIAGV